MVGPAVLLLLLAQAASAQLAAQNPASGPSNSRIPTSEFPSRPSLDPRAATPDFPDARLSDVCFVDPQHGWAVGDRGTIWHTADGGLHWRLQNSGVDCPLASVSFVDPQLGWVAGGRTHPFTHTSSGVVLWTRDGGEHWQHDSKLLLPALRQIRFHGERQGWALGASSAMFPAGVFVTRDAGRSWLPPCGAGSAGWLAGDFLDPQTAVLVGRSGAAFVLQQGELTSMRTAGFGLRSLQRVNLVPPRYGWLSGDGGLIMMTADLGRSWQPPSGELPSGIEVFDFAAMATRGARCWIAGSPGSRVFHTPDGGRTWNAFPTGSTVPICAMTFVDNDRGWAVGHLGVILATDDGGRTWRRQRAGGVRAALLAVFGQPEDVPLELLARTCGNEGYLGIVEVVGRRDVEVPRHEETHVADRMHQAAVVAGASGAETAWRFPLRQPGLRLSARQILDGWDRANGGRGMEVLVATLVRQIRLWRPDVMVTHDRAANDEDPLGSLIHQAVADAVRSAADPGFLPEQIGQAGLEPWSVQRLYAMLPAGQRGGVELSTSQLAFRLGRSVADATEPARGLLEDGFHPAPAEIGFRLVARQPAAGERTTLHGPADPLPAVPTSHGDLLAGITIAPGGEARRPAAGAPAHNVELLHRLAQRRRHTQAILERSERDSHSALRLLAQTEELTRGLDPASAALVIYRIADGYHRSGRWDLAAESYQALVDRYPDEPLCRSALQWLVQYHASGERPGPDSPGPSVAKLEQAVALGREIERTRPDLFAEPGIRFPLAAAYRRLGQPRQADRLYVVDRRGADRDAWWACAQGEAWLAEPKGPPPKPVLACTTAAARPQIDGRLDDAVWRRAKPATLASTLGDDMQWPAVVMFAHDAEFLYIGIHCRQAPGARYETTDALRSRDADLSAYDRVDIFFDVDRDYATYYRLTLDYRGWAVDSCFGDGTWNPSWFVAARSADGTWTVEAALPLATLTVAGKAEQAPRGEDAAKPGAPAAQPGESTLR